MSLDIYEKYGFLELSEFIVVAGLLRCGKSCRLRWTNYLRPGIKRGPFSLEEQNSIVRLHTMLGNR